MGPGELGREALRDEDQLLSEQSPSNYDALFNHHTTRRVMDQFALLFA
jgi:hypothetical protein